MVDIPTLNVVSKGNSLRCGEIIGESLADRIGHAERLLAEYEAFRRLQPWWMPYSVYVYLAQRRASGVLAPPVRHRLPEAYQRLDGMARGARCRRDALYLFHALEMASTQMSEQTEMPLAACTAVAIGQKRSASGHPMLHHNFDQIPLTRPTFAIRKRHETGRYASLEFGLAPLCGTIDGINEHGLAITYNYAWTTKPGPPGPSASMAISEALSCCRNVEEAIQLIIRGGCCGGSMLMLADAQGNIARLELAGSKHRIVRDGRRDTLFHSNAYRTWRMKRRQVSRRARYTDWAPQALQGKRVLDSPRKRDARLRKLLRKRDQLSPDDLSTLMRDHGPHGHGSEDTICMHGDYWQTLATVQLLLAERTLRSNNQCACEGEFVDFAL